MNILYANLCQLNSKYLGMFTTHTKKARIYGNLYFNHNSINNIINNKRPITAFP